ncbi:hypothetical protein ALC53_12390 [Atta colombica]|uniref:Uncharacterized protein n=1 Tax=Atta colombica TaxID=520822 RepID=A0A195AY16_9HYME|nr:hypothetical protein ALC53_12390 [Atta colombica]
MIKVYFAPAVLETVLDEYCKQMIQMVWIIYYPPRSKPRKPGNDQLNETSSVLMHSPLWLVACLLALPTGYTTRGITLKLHSCVPIRITTGCASDATIRYDPRELRFRAALVRSLSKPNEVASLTRGILDEEQTAFREPINLGSWPIRSRFIRFSPFFSSRIEMFLRELRTFEKTSKSAAVIKGPCCLSNYLDTLLLLYVVLTPITLTRSEGPHQTSRATKDSRVSYAVDTERSSKVAATLWEVLTYPSRKLADLLAMPVCMRPRDRGAKLHSWSSFRVACVLTFRTPCLDHVALEPLESSGESLIRGEVISCLCERGGRMKGTDNVQQRTIHQLAA